MRVIHWFRRDLRLQDNTALDYACSIGKEIIGVVILNEEFIKNPGKSGLRMRVLLGYLNALRESMLVRGGALILRYGDPREVLPQLTDEWNAKWVTWNADIEHVVGQRDQRVRIALENKGVHVGILQDRYVLPPLKSDKTKDKEKFESFETFWPSWRRRIGNLSVPKEYPPEEPLQRGAANSPGGDEFPNPNQLNYPELQSLPKPGEEAAILRLKAWVFGAMQESFSLRSHVDEHTTSRISTDLRFGVLSPRQCVHMVKTLLQDPGEGDVEVANEWLKGLAYRDYYVHLAQQFPEISSKPYLKEYEELNWDNNPIHLLAWKEGKTGFPFIDAAMRESRLLGFSSYRARVAAATFLVKVLFINWTKGIEYFSSIFLDSDMALNAGNWQRIASVGPDADPYWKAVDPVIEGKECDPDGEYIKKWIPELAPVSAKYIHEPWLLPLREQKGLRINIGQDYPAPIVNFAKQREQIMLKYRVASLGGINGG